MFHTCVQTGCSNLSYGYGAGVVSAAYYIAQIFNQPESAGKARSWEHLCGFKYKTSRLQGSKSFVALPFFLVINNRSEGGRLNFVLAASMADGSQRGS